ncbi:MAG: HlyD family secretion protein [Candidatus Rokubacteria bacterium]|nr:HlyD family secretion protein [Candidatus Rokubacteria bacterium]
MRSRSAIVVLVLVASAAAAYGAFAWYQSRLVVVTDDAYVDGPVAPVSANISGQVAEVLVRDNETVATGQSLVRLDARDHRAKVEQARAAVRISEERHRAAIERVALGREMAASQRTQAQAASMRAEAARQSAVSVLEATRAIASARRAALAAAVAERERAVALHERATRDLARAAELLQKELVSRQFLDYAEVEVRTAAAQVTAAEERVGQARRDLETAEADIRMRESGFEPQQIGLRTAEARVLDATAQGIQADALQQEVRVREAEQGLALAQLREAQANLALALINLEYTEIRAPLAGMAAKKSVEVGQVVQPGQPLLAILALHDVWVIANFKETQLHRVRSGMRAEVVVDTYPERTYTGTVESIAAGTGARFSLLPPENATGNWVKVVQRIPVKIVLDPHGGANPHALRAGMSVVVTVRAR